MSCTKLIESPALNEICDTGAFFFPFICKSCGLYAFPPLPSGVVAFDLGEHQWLPLGSHLMGPQLAWASLAPGF